MLANDFWRRLNQRGFTFLELIVVIAIISILAVFALDRYYKLLVDVERTSLEHDLGVMRSAVSMQVAAHYVAGDMPGLLDLTGSNPMDLLSEQPNNYLGIVTDQALEDVKQGSWIYLQHEKTLVYIVRNQLHFNSVLAGVPRARFKIVPVYSDKSGRDANQAYLSGLSLQALESYRWQNPWE